MNESIPPMNRSGSNKGIIFLLCGGLLILIAAGAILYKRRSDSAEPPLEPPKIEQRMETPTPLMVSQPVLKPLNTEPQEDNNEQADTANKDRQRIKREKMGTIDPNVVSKFMNARFGQVKACYENRLKKNAFLEGKLDLNIGVLSTGKVKSVSVNNDTVRDQPMLACVKRTISGWDFPAPTGGQVVIAKTFNFKKKGK